VFELTRRAQNDNKFQSLFSGNTGGHNSASEADLALCCKLAFYTQGDFLSIDKFFRISGLFRTKWDEKHGARTYGDMTIVKALQFQREYYTSPAERTYNEPPITQDPPQEPLTESPLELNAAPTFTLSDMGNAERFLKHHQDQVRYCTTWHHWLLWNGKYWEKDDKNQAHQLAKQTVRHMYIEAGHKDDDKQRKALVKHALDSENNKRIKNLLEQATWNPDIAITANELDAHPWLLNLQNGTLDLKTNTLKPHARLDLLTHYVNIPYDPKAQCPQWHNFLNKIMSNNQDIIGFLQRAVGYSLTSETNEQCLFFLYGQGQNGKTTFIETVLENLLDKYARRISTEALLLKRHPVNANNEIARLKGARIAITSEISQSRRLNESLVKDLTGEDTISARFLYSEPFDFKPTSKLWVYGNHKPIITGIDDGIWRRIKLIPFTVRIPDKEKDLSIKKKLLAELPGILQWAVKGCQLWQQHGLQEPQEVIEATQVYRREMDNIELFLEECCVIQPGVRTTARELYEAYVGWCRKNEEEVLSQKKMGEHLTKKGIERKKGMYGWGWLGIGLVNMTL
jgi:putative DNA primase/helicase